MVIPNLTSLAILFLLLIIFHLILTEILEISYFCIPSEILLGLCILLGFIIIVMGIFAIPSFLPVNIELNAFWSVLISLFSLALLLITTKMENKNKRNKSKAMLIAMICFIFFGIILNSLFYHTSSSMNLENDLNNHSVAIALVSLGLALIIFLTSDSE
ncbi:hypothetical protein [Guptibacillus hwajinpoensis]|uniref:hypothetical protein n=1 Tax=Guptibacillus hwajinpoensis TaxID=208199 RepID=UPI001CFEFEA2|nr:hypothetical protein [Pseudalkalibacillus hwajinpoensis]WLR60155.1 hypothetical protein LC071_01825 [Pseudalkalibacillus hwajinpoensis]